MSTEPMRLQRYLARAGVASRRQAEVLITDGKVKVNGKPATLGMSVVPGKDRVTVGRNVITLAVKAVDRLPQADRGGHHRR